ncbi:GAF domain-containing protein [Deinococcus aestuarii]|uniref:GAF domain-containing protein n=1 Tax=Deinococcus aestuarii TaxID=2774531 RepID=UPI001C0D62C1|nr:GAF domain-containing protein [Deinococcus aestuarii]
MDTPPHPAEARRVDELRRHHILDTPPDRRFDLIAESAARLYQTPIALVTFLDETRQWFKAAIGLTLRETPRAVSFCTHALATLDVLVVPDAAHDPRFRDNPLVTGEPQVRFYAGAPIITRGYALGTVCVLDCQPRPLPAQELWALTQLARLVGELLEHGTAGTPFVPAPRPPHPPAACVVVDACGQVLSMSDPAREALNLSGNVPGRHVHNVLRLHWEEDAARAKAAVEGGERWTGRAVLTVPEGPSFEGPVFRALVTVTPLAGRDHRLYLWSADRLST